MTICENMFRIMQERHIKSVQLAKKLGVKQSVISSWKTRGTNPPSEYLLSICDLLGVTIYELFEVESPYAAPDECELLSWYKHCCQTDKNVIRDLAMRLCSDTTP